MTSYTSSTADVTSGTVVLTLTTNDPSGSCVAVSSQLTLTIDALPVVSAGVDVDACPGDTVPLNGSITGSITTGSWNTSGTGTFDNPTSLSAIYTSSAADKTSGSVALTMTSDVPPGSCVAVSSQLTLTLDALPVVSAGTDVAICPGDNVPLNGSITGSITTGSWNTSGSGILDNPTNLTAIYTPSAADESSGSVVLTLTSDDPPGVCNPASSQITVGISGNITVNQVTATAQIGMTSNVDAVSAATLNLFDTVIPL